MDKHAKHKEAKTQSIARRPVHVLAQYGNPDKIVMLPGADETCRVSYEDGNGRKIMIEEVISKDSGKHVLELTSTAYVLEGDIGGAYEQRESAIHYHPKKGHPDHHLEFSIRLAKSQNIRIYIEKLDTDDYLRCVKGFLRISKEIIAQECQRDKIDDLSSHFFTETIDELDADRTYLIKRVQQSRILGADDRPIEGQQLHHLKQDIHMLPFFE